MLKLCTLLFLALLCGLTAAEDFSKMTPPKAAPPFTQSISKLGLFDIQSDLGKEFHAKLTDSVNLFEQKFFATFKFPPGLLKGNDPNIRATQAQTVPGALLSSWKYLPWIEIKVFKRQSDYAETLLADRETIARMNQPRNAEYRKEPPETLEYYKVSQATYSSYFGTFTYSDAFLGRFIRVSAGDLPWENIEYAVLNTMSTALFSSTLHTFNHQPAWVLLGARGALPPLWTTAPEAALQRKKYIAILNEALKAGETVPLKELMALNRETALGTASAAYDQLLMAQFYSLFSYLLEKEPTRFTAFLDNTRNIYLKRWAASARSETATAEASQPAAFREVFGFTIEELEPLWKKYAQDTFDRELRKDPVLYYWCGDYLLLRKDKEAATARFKKCLEVAPKSIEGLIGLGRAAAHFKDYPEALKDLKQAAEQDPKNLDAQYYLGIVQSKSGAHKDALATFEALTKSSPNTGKYWGWLGNEYLHTRDFAKAPEMFDNAYALDPTYSLYYIGKGIAAYFRHDYQESSHQLSFAYFGNSTDPVCGFWMGMKIMRQYDNQGAGHLRSALRTAIDKKPGDLYIYKMAVEMAEKKEALNFKLDVPEADENTPGPGSTEEYTKRYDIPNYLPDQE